MAWKSSSKKNKASAAEQGALRQLSSVRRQRAPFERLSRKIIASTLERYLPEQGPLVEIGMGDGQLYERLPSGVLPRMVHTEPLAAASREFRRRYPSVQVLQAPAEKLPFAAGEVAAVVGLCVLDVVEDQAEVARELARVLRPGGRLIHWLDMSTALGDIIGALAARDLVPLPNVFSDPSAAQWPEDLFLIARGELAIIAQLLTTHRHPLAAPLAQYLRLFGAHPFVLAPALAEFVRLQESGEIRAALRAMFRAAYELASPALKPELARFQGRPFSSAFHFEQLLKRSFTEAAGFDVELSRIETAWELAPRPEGGWDYMSSCVGEQRHLSAVPEVLLCSDAMVGTKVESLFELGVFTFVVTRKRAVSVE